MNKGVLSAAGAYILWGFFPIYFHALNNVPPFEVVAHRIVWSFLFVLLVVLIRREFLSFRSAITPRTLRIYLIAGVLLSVNWMIYIYGINSGFVVEASLGYFINPLVNVLLGVLLFRERLRPLQWVPVGLAAVGVTYLAINYGTLPWIALGLAFTFGMYGLVKKVAPLGSLHGLTLETSTIFLPALAYLSYLGLKGDSSFGQASWVTTLLLALTGVITAIPLLFFASGARLVPLTTLGLLQYISPMMQFITGVFLFHEPFTSARLIGFCIIWVALLIFSVEGFFEWQKVANAAGAET